MLISLCQILVVKYHMTGIMLKSSFPQVSCFKSNLAFIWLICVHIYFWILEAARLHPQKLILLSNMIGCCAALVQSSVKLQSDCGHLKSHSFLDFMALQDKKSNHLKRKVIKPLNEKSHHEAKDPYINLFIWFWNSFLDQHSGKFCRN